MRSEPGVGARGPTRRWGKGVTLAVFSLSAAFGYNPQTAPLWQAGETVELNLQLGTLTKGPLLDGSITWNEPVLAAIAAWNHHLGTTQLRGVRDGTAQIAKNNGANTITFGADAFGEAWPARVLAYTYIFANGSRRTEADIVFNSSTWTWNSYRGVPRANVYDLQRVTLHELGHAIGLDHPDAIGQSESAVMNSTYSDGDVLLPDDINGAAFLYHTNDVIITAQPPSFTTEHGGSVTFTVAARGNPTRFQWRKDGVDIPDAISSSLQLTNIQPSSRGGYTVFMANASSTVVSEPGILTVNTPPELSSITPGNWVVAANSATQLAVALSGTPAATLKWQVSTDSGETWLDLVNDGTYAGVSTTLLNIARVTAAMSGHQYKITATNYLGSTWQKFTLTVASANAAPFFSLQPRDQTVLEGERVQFRAEASGVPTATLMWQMSTNDGATWTNLAGVAGYEGATVRFFEIVGASLSPSNALYRCLATNAAGSTASRPARLAVSSIPVLPVISTQPLRQTVRAGGSVTFNVAATGTETLHYQWQKDGVPIGINFDSATLTNVQPHQAGNYTVVVDNRAGSVTSQAAALTVASPGAPATRFANIATRAYCSTGNNVTIGGFVISGSVRKRVLVRAVGPSLTTQGIAGSEVLLDPTIAVYDATRGNTVVATNDNWGDNANAAEITATAARIGAAALAPGDARSSALLLDLAPGVYSFIVNGQAGAAGIVLLEVYDADATLPTSTFVNIATRARCTTGNGVTIGGFVVTGVVSKQILLRAIGPTLTPQGIGTTEVLTDPAIELYDAQRGNVVVAANDDWWDNVNVDAIRTTGARVGATPLSVNDTTSSALLLVLNPGVYSFVARGKSATSGILLVEVYDAD